MEHRITDIHCPQCGAPADFDIVKQNKPSTTVGYGIRMNAKGWKLKGYIYLNVILTTK